MYDIMARGDFKPASYDNLDGKQKPSYSFQKHSNQAFIYACKRPGHNHGPNDLACDINHTRPVDFVKTLRDGSDFDKKSRSNSRNTKDRKADNFEKIKPAARELDILSEAHREEAVKPQRVKNSAKYKKSYEVGGSLITGGKQYDGNLDKHTSQDNCSDHLRYSADSSSHQMTHNKADKIPKITHKSKTSENFMPNDSKKSDNKTSVQESDMIERGADSIGIDFTKAKKASTGYGQNRSPKARLSQKDPEEVEDATGQLDATDQDQTEGKSGIELRTNTNWLPLNSEAKESMDRLEYNFQDLTNKLADDERRMAEGEDGLCTESTVLRPPEGNTILDDEDGFLATDIFAAFESVQKGINSINYNMDEKPVKQSGLKGR